MDTCDRHGSFLITVVDGTAVCPACETAAVADMISQGLALEGAKAAQWAVPAEGTGTRQLRPVTIRLENRDVQRAKVLAKEVGMPYQRYVRGLITRALDNEERQMFGHKASDHPTRGPEGPPARLGRR